MGINNSSLWDFLYPFKC